MGKLIASIVQEVEYTIDNLEMYRELGCYVPDAVIKHYNDIMDDSYALHLTRQRRSHEDSLEVQIRKMKSLKTRLTKIEES